MDSLILKLHNFFRNENDRKATQSFDPRPLIFKLQQKVLKFNDICVSWSSPKIDLETNFLNLENFWERQFFSIVTFKKIFDIPLLIDLFIPLTELNNIH